MQIKLLSLHIRNFKGIKDLLATFSALGETNIYGANEAGKTTIVDAYFWLTTGRDSSGRADFNIKNTKHSERNRADHEVIAELLVNGAHTTLRKVYREKWEKKTGELEPSLVGNTTEYFFNGVPFKEKEFQNVIGTWATADTFKLVTNPFYFNTGLKWQDRREVLLQVAGQINDRELAGENVDFKELINIITNKRVTMEQFRKEVAAGIRDLKTEIEQIGPRIDEATRTLPKEELNEETIRHQLAARTGNLQQVDELMQNKQEADREKAKAQEKIQDEIHAAKRNLKQLSFTLEEQLSSEDNEGLKKQNELKKSREVILNSIDVRNKDISAARATVDRYAEQRTKLVSEWKNENARIFEFAEFNPELTTSCPVCEQAIPAEELESKRKTLREKYDQEKDTAEKRFNESKKVNLANIEAEGDKIKSQQERAQTSVDEFTDQLSKETESLREVLELLAKTQDAYTAPAPIEQRLATLLESNEEAKAISKQLEDLQSQVQEVPRADLSELRERKTEISRNIDALNQQLGEISKAMQTRTRIEELKQQQRDLAQKLADLEMQEFTIAEFKRAQDDELERRINGKFKYVSFKLFNRLVNGSIEPTCETLLKRVPYADLNTAGKVIAGLDINNTLQEHYGIRVPVFLDNRESTSNIIEMNCQVINLFVSPNDTELRIES